MCFRIYDKLMIHSDLSKAESWARLTDEFLNSPLPNTNGTKVQMPQTWSKSLKKPKSSVKNLVAHHVASQFWLLTDWRALQCAVAAALLIGIPLKYRLYRETQGEGGRWGKQTHIGPHKCGFWPNLNQLTSCVCRPRGHLWLDKVPDGGWGLWHRTIPRHPCESIFSSSLPLQ